MSLIASINYAFIMDSRELLQKGKNLATQDIRKSKA